MGERRRERDLILLEKGFLVTSFYWNYLDFNLRRLDVQWDIL